MVSGLRPALGSSPPSSHSHHCPITGTSGVALSSWLRALSLSSFSIPHGIGFCLPSLPDLRRLAHILEWTGSGSLQEMRFCSRTQKDLVSSFSTCPSWRCDLG